jgi:glycosyltransferase involved in cell wall biosynthesis
MLRVAVTSDAVRGRNGVGTYYDDLVQHLTGRVGVIELICPPQPGRGSDSAGWRFPMPGDRTQTLFVPRLFRLWKQVRAVSPHVVVAPTPWLYGLVGMVAALGMGAAFTVGYHTEFSDLADLYWERRPLVRGVMRRLARAVDAIMFRNATAVVVYNRNLQDSVRSRGVRNAPLLGTPVAASFLAHPVEPIPDRMSAVTYVGRLAPEKRIDQVLDVARALPEVRMRIVGDGPLRESVERCRAQCGNIDLFGWVDRDRVRGILDRTDLLVLPSVQETFGTAAFEGMIRGRPVLVSPGCGIAQWPDLSEGLFRIAEGETLLDAVRRVRNLDPVDRRRVAERGRAAAVRLHERTIDDWLSTLVQAASGRGA